MAENGKDDTTYHVEMRENAVKTGAAYSIADGGEWKPVVPGSKTPVSRGQVRLRAGFGENRGAGQTLRITAEEEPCTVLVENGNTEHGIENAASRGRSVVLRWNALEPDVTYNIYRGEGDAGLALYASGLSGNCFADADILPGKTYTYHITACKKAESEEDGEECAAGSDAAASVLEQKYPQVKEWQKYVYFKPERRGEYNCDINPIFLKRLAALAKAYLKERLYITWGFRTHAEQAAIYHAFTDHDGPATEAPETSWHEFRLAADVQTYIVRRLPERALEKFGLARPDAKAPGHLQPIETVGCPQEERAAFASAANCGFHFASEGKNSLEIKCPYCGRVF